MNTIDASVRDTKTKGQVRALRKNGNVPAIVYGGSEQNEKVSVSKKTINALISKENFLSNILTLNINGKTQNVLPKELKYNVVTDDIIHIDFVRLLEGAKIILNIPVKFINNSDCPGLKVGGVLNIVRRKVELKCPTENIPSELVVDLDGVDIGESFKISSIKLPENVVPVIQGRDFVIATLAAPTVMKEPEKPTETAEAATESAEGETKSAETENKDGDKKDSEDKKSPAEKK